MYLSRDPFAVPFVRDLTRTRRDRFVQSGIVPERADRAVPGLDVFLAWEDLRLERHRIGNRQDAAATAVAEVTADDVRQRAAIADERWNGVDHGLGGDAAKRFFPHRRNDEDARQR